MLEKGLEQSAVLNQQSTKNQRMHGMQVWGSVWTLYIHQRRDSNINKGVLDVTKYKTQFQTEIEKRKFIIQSFKLDQNEILNKDAELKDVVIKLFLDNFMVLALYPNHFGITDLLEIKIELEPGAVPKRSGIRPLNPDQRSDLKTQIDDWIHEGVIEPSNCPWAFPLVPVKKKEGKMRWVTYLRGLNCQKVKKANPLANVQENLQKLKGATVFSSLDAAGAYHAVVIEPYTRDCTAFISQFGTFHYNFLTINYF